MKYETKEIITFLAAFWLAMLLFSIFAAIVTSKSTVDNLIICPDKNQTLIKVTAHIPYVSGQIPKQMRVVVEECNGDLGICYANVQNISMMNRGAGNYQRRNISLLHEDATYINCKVMRLNTDGIWYEIMSERYDL